MNKWTRWHRKILKKLFGIITKKLIHRTRRDADNYYIAYKKVDGICIFYKKAQLYTDQELTELLKDLMAQRYHEEIEDDEIESYVKTPPLKELEGEVNLFVPRGTADRVKHTEIVCIVKDVLKYNKFEILSSDTGEAGTSIQAIKNQDEE